MGEAPFAYQKHILNKKTGAIPKGIRRKLSPKRLKQKSHFSKIVAFLLDSDQPFLKTNGQTR